MKIAAGLILVALVACDAGPMPAAPAPVKATDPRGYREDWFPSRSWDALPLNRAILADKLDEVRTLLEQGADPNARWGQSGDRLPLQDVFESDRFGYRVTDPTAMVRLLLAHGADPNAKWCPFESRGFDSGGCKSARAFTPLMAAAGEGLTDAITMLLDAGADPTARTWNGESALDLAGTTVAFELISRALFPDIATRDQRALNWIRDDTVNPIWSDASLFSLTLSRALWFRTLPPPPPPGVLDDPRNAARAREAYRRFEDGLVERFGTLLRIGANPNQRSTDHRDQDTALGNAVRWGHLRAARVLLTGGADVNARECFQVGFDQNLRRPTFDPACTSEKGSTALMSVAASGQRDAVLLLLEFKADRSLKDWAGRTAFDYAKTPAMKDMLAAGR